MRTKSRSLDLLQEAGFPLLKVLRDAGGKSKKKDQKLEGRNMTKDTEGLRRRLEMKFEAGASQMEALNFAIQVGMRQWSKCTKAKDKQELQRSLAFLRRERRKLKKMISDDMKIYERIKGGGCGKVEAQRGSGRGRLS